MDSLFINAANGNWEKMKQILQLGVVDVNAKNEDGWTALHVAANDGHIEVAKLLIEAGADINKAVDDNPLQIANQERHSETNLYGTTPLSEKATNQTPLFVAASKGHLGVVRLLLDH